MRQFPTWLKPLTLFIGFIVVAGIAAVLLYQHVEQRRQSEQPPSITGSNCGEIRMGWQGDQEGYYTGPFTGPSAAKQAIDCFWGAYVRCQPASIVYDQMGVDTGFSKTYTVQVAHGACHVAVSTYSFVNVSPPTKGGPYACASLQQQGDGLVALRCGPLGDLALTVPLLIPAPSGQACGNVDPLDPDATAETCFIHAWSACQAAWLALVPRDPMDERPLQLPIHTLSISLRDGACALEDDFQIFVYQDSQPGQERIPQPFVVYQCAGMIAQPDGLHAQACGAEGNLLIPAAIPRPPQPGAQCYGVYQSSFSIYKTGNGDPLGCLWQSYTRCTLASFEFTHDFGNSGPPTQIETEEYTFVTQPNGKACQLTVARQFTYIDAPRSAFQTFTCAGLAQQPDGLLARGCGAVGDIFIPQATS